MEKFKLFSIFAWIAVNISSTLAQKQGCHTDFSRPSGRLFTKNFPEEYPTTSNCTWAISVDSGRKVKLTFHIFNVESHEHCIWDWVRIFDSDGSLVKHICGSIEEDMTLYSTNNTLLVQFYSDDSINTAGFFATWEEVFEMEDTFNKNQKQGYVLSFPQSFTASSQESTKAPQLCLQLFNVNSNGKVNIRLFSGDYLIHYNANATVAHEVDYQSGDEDIHCYSVGLPVAVNMLHAIVGIEANFPEEDYSILAYKSVQVFQPLPLTLIQTDKYDYRPGQEVKARILLMTEALKPSKKSNVEEIWIQEPSGSRLAQWNNLSLNTAVGQISYTLPKEPNLGLWTITAKVGTNETKAYFDVNEHVLPTFEVTLEGPKIILKESNEERYKVCAKYTHGTMVKGTANVTFSTKYKIDSYWRAPWTIETINKLVDLVYGCAMISLKTNDVQNLVGKSTPIKTVAIVKEAATGEKQNTTINIQVKTTPFLIKISGHTEYILEGGFPYIGQVKIVDHGDNPIDIGTVALNICAKLVNFKEMFCIDKISDANGVLDFAVNLPNIDRPRFDELLIITATAIDYPANETSGMEQPVKLHNVSLIHTTATSALTISAGQAKLKCGINEVSIFISAPAETAIELAYFLVSGGFMQTSGSTKIAMGHTDQMDAYIGNSNIINFMVDSSVNSVSILTEHKLIFKRPFSMEGVTGKFKLLAFIIDPMTEVTLTSMQEFNSEFCFSKPRLTWSAQELNPGKPVNLRLNGPAKGLCGYSVVDKAVNLVSNPNKITEDKLQNVVEAFANEHMIVNADKKCHQCARRPLLEAFVKLGLILLSDRLQNSAECVCLIDVQEEVYDKALSEAQPKDCMQQQDSPDYYQYFLESSSYVDEALDEPIPNEVILTDLTANTVVPPEEEVNKPSLELRNYFPETWLFDLVDLDTDGQYNMDVTTPHTITTWIGEAFCTHELTGFAIAESSNLLVNQDFFVDLKLPYSVKRGEIFQLNISAFNSLELRRLPLMLSVLTSPEDEYKLGTSETHVCVNPQDSHTESFSIKMTALHEINITVEARIEGLPGCDHAGSAQGFADKVQKSIQVKPEGFPVEKVDSEFICQTPDELSTIFELDPLELPADLVEDSARAWTSVSGDILAPSLSNLDKLVNMPSGCGEQNMISLVPNIYVVNYLMGTVQDKPDLVAKAKQYMKAGYNRQEELYRHLDGSYSVWGPSDDKAEGSVWLTAFVVKAFSQAAKYIDVDSAKLMKSMYWLKKMQDRRTGCFQTKGFNIHSEFMGDQLTLTASLIITMLEKKVEQRRSVENGLTCVDLNITAESDIYSKTLVAYAMVLEGSEDYVQKSNNILNELLEVAKVDKPGKLYWKSDLTTIRPTSKDVEITAYNVLSLIQHERLPEALQAIKWLATQRNSRGGFKSTQDTIIALQAMSEYSLKVTQMDNDLQIMVSCGGSNYNFDVKKSNKLLLQSKKMNLNPTENKVSVEINGGGCVMVQTLFRYNVKNSPNDKSFELKVKQNEVGHLKFCGKYTGTNDVTNMVVIEVELISGYEPVKGSLETLKANSEVKKFEYDFRENSVALYYNNMPKVETCNSFTVVQKEEITELKSAIAKVYDYYNQEDIFYTEYKIT